MASGIPAVEIRLSLYSMAIPSTLDFLRAANLADKHEQRIVELIHDPLLQRNDGVVGDMDIFGTDLSAALGDVTEADAQLFLQQTCAGGAVERMHLKRSGAYEEPRAAKLLLLAVVAQDEADILAEEALNALAKLLYAIYVPLVHLPNGVRARLERRDLLIDSEIPGHVGDQVLYHRESLHRKDSDGLIERKSVHARLAGEPRPAVDLGRA